MNTRILEYIIAVHETSSFIDAANKCFVSQPALSMQIKKLEESLGIQIFERGSKNIMTTEIGKKIITQAYTVLDEVSDLNKIADMYLADGIINIAIGAFPTLCPYLIPKILPTIKEQIPNISIKLFEDKTEILLEKLEQGKLDFALLAAPIDDKHLVSKELFLDKFYLAVSTSNPLSKQKNVSINDISEQNLMFLGDGHCLRDQAIEFCAKNNINVNDFKGSSLETLRQMVSIDEGVTFIPKIAITKNTKIRYQNIADVNFNRKICLVMRKSSIYSELFKSLAEIISKNYK